MKTIDRIMLHKVAKENLIIEMNSFYNLELSINQLNELEQNKGITAIIGLWGWYLSGYKRKLTKSQIFPAISRELHNRNDESEPWTNNYIKYAENWFENKYNK